MQAQFGYYNPEDSTSGAYSTTASGVTFGGTSDSPFQHFAIGAFTGDNGLPPYGTLFNSEADYFNYAMKLTEKTDQVSSEGLNFNLANVVGSWIVIGGTGDDKVNANGQTGPAVTGDGMLSGGLGDDSLVAGSGNDRISGGDGNDTLNGGAGDDTISAGTGADMLRGGAGHNTYDMSDLSTAVTFDTSVSGPQTVAGETKDIAGFDNLIGTSQGDSFTGNGGDNHFQGGDGNDTLAGGYGQDTIEGQGGDDLIRAGLGDQTLSGGNGNDTLSYADVYLGVHIDLAYQDGVTSQFAGFGAQILTGFENLTGSDQADSLAGDSGVNTILGGGGNDTINGRGGDDVLSGGGGVNTVSYATSLNGVVVDLNQQGAAQDTGVGSQTLSGFTNLEGSHYADQLTGDANDNTILSGGGADTLDGGDGHNTVSFSDVNGGVLVDLSAGYFLDQFGNQGSLANFQDVIGSGLDDQIAGSDGDNDLSGLAGNDRLFARDGTDTLDGGAGSDTASFAFSLAGVTVDLGQQGSAQDTGSGSKTLISIENLQGGSYSDHLTGDANANVLDGGAGDDVLVSGDGSDNISGGDGNDTVLAGAGDQALAGGDGVDLVSYANANTYVNVSLALQDQAQDTNIGQQTLSGFENLTGGAQDDSLYGDDNANVIDGNGGSNYIAGAGGADTIFASAGNDLIDGGQGVDTVSFAHLALAVTFDLSNTGMQDTGGGSFRISNVENLIGSDQADTLKGDDANTTTTGANLINGGGGADTIVATAGDDTMIGGGGNDTVSYAGVASGVTVDLSATGVQSQGFGAEVLSGIENLVGSGYADTLTGDSGANKLEGAGGADTIVASVGDDTMDGGAGNNTLSFLGSGGVTVDLSTTTAQYTGLGFQVISNFDTVIGSDYDDALTGSAGAENLNGAAGNDTIDGGGGDDTLGGGYGVNTLSYASASTGVTADLSVQDGTAQETGVGSQIIQNFDNLIGSDHDDKLTGTTLANLIQGGSGDDTILGFGGNDTLVGGGGVNTVSYASAQVDITVDLSKHRAQLTGDGNQTLSGFNNVMGSAYDDRLTGDSRANRLEGGDGADTLVGGGGRDVLVGGSGVDTADFSGSAAGVRVDLSIMGVQQTRVGLLDISGVENLIGSSHADLLAGDSSDNTIFGGDGADTIVASTGHDSLEGGAGTDTLDLSRLAEGAHVSVATGSLQILDGSTASITGFERFTGTNYGDQFDDAAGDQSYSGGRGDDQFLFAGGNDTIDGGAGNDTLDFSGVANAVTVNLGDRQAQDTGAGVVTIRNVETLSGSHYSDHLTGDGNANVIQGGALLSGPQGPDTINGGGGDDTLIGTNSGDTVSYAGAKQGVQVVLFNQGAVQQTGVGNQLLEGFSNVEGSSHNDQLAGDSNDNVISAGAGRDVILATAGNDTYDGGAGLDLLIYQGSGPIIVDFRNGVVDVAGFTQTIISIEAVIGSNSNNLYLDDDAFRAILGGLGRDTVVAGLGGDVYAGGGGIDLLDFSAGNGVSIDLENFKAQDTGLGVKFIRDFDQVIGSHGNDTLLGASAANLIDGNGGDDIINGRGGNDTLKGGDGGESTLSYAGATTGVHVSLDLQGSAQDTGVGLQVLNNFNTVVGSSYDDTLQGAGRGERLDGARGDDHLSGLGGADTLVGGAGKDVLDGGTAGDTLVSLGDGDQLTGGTGADTFRFDDLQVKNAATITDLAANETIDLRGAETSSGVSFTEVTQFHHTAGEFLLSYDQASNSTTVRFDVDGDGKADHLITLQGGDFTAFSHFQL